MTRQTTPWSGSSDDVVAVVDAIAASAGTRVDVYGVSSGASYALAAAALTDNIRRFVLYEPEAGGAQDLLPAGLVERLEAMLAAGERAQAVETFFREALGLTDEELATMRTHPSRPGRVESAHTFPRELATPPDR